MSPLYYIFGVIITLVVFKIYVKLSIGWCRSQQTLIGKTAIITGASSGIGFETAADLAKRGAKVIIACRNETKAKKSVADLINLTNNPNITYKILDLSSLKSVRNFVGEIVSSVERLDILINNAGIHDPEPGQEKTEDGLEAIMGTNYFGPFLLTNLLLDLLKKSAPSRIVNVASTAAMQLPLNVEKINKPSSIHNQLTYGRSKLCNILFTIELNRLLKGTGVTSYSVHPGLVLTDITRNTHFKILVDVTFKLFFKNALEGAQSTIYCAVAKDIEKYSGEHFEDCHVVGRYWTARNPDRPTALWKKTEEILNTNFQSQGF